MLIVQQQLQQQASNDNFTQVKYLINVLLQLSAVHNSNYTTFIMKSDSGATNHYIKKTDSNNLQNISLSNAINVALPDGSNLTSTHTGFLPIPSVTTPATQAHALPHLETSLLSLGQLADNRCLILLN